MIDVYDLMSYKCVDLRRFSFNSIKRFIIDLIVHFIRILHFFKIVSAITYRVENRRWNLISVVLSQKLILHFYIRFIYESERI